MQIVDINEQVEVFEHLKYPGSLKLVDGNCSKDTRSRIRMAMKIILDLVPIWRDRGMNKDLKMVLQFSLIAQNAGLTNADAKSFESADLWIYRRML